MPQLHAHIHGNGAVPDPKCDFCNTHAKLTLCVFDTPHGETWVTICDPCVTREKAPPSKSQYARLTRVYPYTEPSVTL